jgi:glutaredoxin 3
VNVEIYTKAFCPYCERAKELLRIKGVAFVEYLIDDDPPRAAEMLRRGGAPTVPEIFIAGRLIGGCAELFELDENGRLDQLLAASP